MCSYGCLGYTGKVLKFYTIDFHYSIELVQNFRYWTAGGPHYSFINKSSLFMLLNKRLPNTENTAHKASKQILRYSSNPVICIWTKFWKTFFCSVRQHPWLSTIRNTAYRISKEFLLQSSKTNHQLQTSPPPRSKACNCKLITPSTVEMMITYFITCIYLLFFYSSCKEIFL